MYHKEWIMRAWYGITLFKGPWWHIRKAANWKNRSGSAEQMQRQPKLAPKYCNMGNWNATDEEFTRKFKNWFKISLLTRATGSHAQEYSTKSTATISTHDIVIKCPAGDEWDEVSGHLARRNTKKTLLCTTQPSKEKNRPSHHSSSELHTFWLLSCLLAEEFVQQLMISAVSAMARSKNHGNHVCSRRRSFSNRSCCSHGLLSSCPKTLYKYIAIHQHSSSGISSETCILAAASHQVQNLHFFEGGFGWDGGGIEPQFLLARHYSVLNLTPEPRAGRNIPPHRLKSRGGVVFPKI